MQGKIFLYKEADMTSQQAVSRLRKLLGMKKIGHSGTLDPMATGVLNCFVGQATKFIDLLMQDEKTYRAAFILGKTSDTLDIWGKVTDHTYVPPSEDKLREILGSFLGKSFQIPPMYSALKYQGRALYKYAREGIEISRKERAMTLFQAELLHFDGEKGELRLRCSRGTYVRTLIDDMGQRLGTGALMSGLLRERNDWASLEDCVTLEEIAAMCERGDKSFLLDADKNVNLPKHIISGELYQDLLHGRIKTLLSGSGEGRVLLYSGGNFLGTAFWVNGELIKEKLLQVDYDS